MTPKGEVLDGDAVPAELLAAVIDREQEAAASLPSWRRARGSWFGVPSADAAPVEPEPWSWRQATALEQGTTGEGFAFADPLAAATADLPLPPAEAEGPAARRLRELKEAYGREAERGEARWNDRLLEGLARLLHALPTGGGYDITYTLGGGGGDRGGLWKTIGDLKRGLGSRRPAAPRARKGMAAWKGGWERGDI